MMQHNNTANTRRSLCALAIVFTSTKWGGGGGGCSLIRACLLIRSNTVCIKFTDIKNIFCCMVAFIYKAVLKGKGYLGGYQNGLV